MFHQANTRDYDGHGHSLLSDLLDATLAKYAAAATFPIVCPTMDELAAARGGADGVRRRAGLTATIQPGVSITLAVANAATVPVTGLCTPTAEQYGGQTILARRAERRAVGDAGADGLQRGRADRAEARGRRQQRPRRARAGRPR